MNFQRPLFHSYCQKIKYEAYHFSRVEEKFTSEYYLVKFSSGSANYINCALFSGFSGELCLGNLLSEKGAAIQIAFFGKPPDQITQQSLNLKLLYTCEGMSLSHHFPEDILKAQLEIVEIENRIQAENYYNVLEQIYTDLEDKKYLREYSYQFVKKNSYCSTTRKHYVAYLNSKPVSVGTVSFEKENVYIFDVATIHSCRRRGYAKCLLDEILKRSFTHQQIQNALLLSTSAGKKLYMGLGFTGFCNVYFYKREGENIK